MRFLTHKGLVDSVVVRGEDVVPITLDGVKFVISLVPNDPDKSVNVKVHPDTEDLMTECNREFFLDQVTEAFFYDADLEVETEDGRMAWIDWED
jgi:hypothetical protein